MKVAFIFGPGGANEDPAGMISYYERKEAAAQRLAATGHPHPFRHIVHEGAGHLIAAAPYRPTTQSVFPGPGVPFQYGGTPAADAAARLATWHETLRFLDQALHS